MLEKLFSRRVGILLANRPRLRREIVRKIIERQSDMDILGEVLNPIDLLVTVGETKADVVIVALENSKRPALCTHLLAEYPNLTILGLSSKGESAFIEQLSPRRWEINDPSETSVLSALRHAVRFRYGFEEEARKDARRA